jgi:hypothetical protein
MMGWWNAWWMLPLLLAIPGSLAASPPLCRETDVDRFVRADLIVEGRPVEARRSGLPGGWLGLEATFVVEAAFKGGMARGRRLLVVRSCENRPVPPQFLGYPQAQHYCPGSEGPRITGVDPSGGVPGARRDTWILHLARSADPGRWKEIGIGAYHGCGKGRADLSPNDRAGYDRLRARAAELGR